MIIEYKIDNVSKADVIDDTPDDTMSELAPPPKYIIIINLIIKYEPAGRTKVYKSINFYLGGEERQCQNVKIYPKKIMVEPAKNGGWARQRGGQDHFK